MWTQRDQIQAYQFLRRRLVSALVASDANHPVSPSRRLILGTVLGVVVALLITAVFGVIGLLKPTGGKDWLSGGHVIVEEETGARFILGQDNVLHPVLNYASARLLAGGNGDATVTVPAKTLATAPRGTGVGIAGAPDSLPGSGNLVTSAWLSCSRTSEDAPSAAEPSATVLLGATGDGHELGSGEGLLVRLPGGDRYLLASGHRFRLSAQASTALGYDQRTPIVVSGRWLDTVPAGRDLGFLAVEQAGDRGPRVGDLDTKVGQVLVVSDSMSTPPTPAGYYLVRPDGLEAITQTEASLIRSNPDNSAAYEGSNPGSIQVGAAAVAAVGRVNQAGGSGGADATDYPERIPGAVPVTGGAVSVCAQSGGSAPARLTISGQVPLPQGGRTIPVGKGTDSRVADEVYVPPSGGAVVAEQPAPGAPSGTTYLVTDSGEKYPVATAQAVASLGYGGATKQAVPAGLLALLPTGPALDPATAAQLVPLTAGTG